MTNWHKAVGRLWCVLILLAAVSCSGTQTLETEPQTPRIAASDRVIYMVIVDRFENGDSTNDGVVEPTNPGGFHGGDFAGLSGRMDYIASLGVNTIWMNPIVEQIEHAMGGSFDHWGFHGYWAEHFDRIEPRLGTREELQQLLDTAHGSGVEIILDVVLNHPGYGSHFVNDESWVRSTETGTCPGQEATDIDQCLFGLPDFRTEDPAVAQQLVEWQTAWFAEFPFDGLRADTVKHIEKELWATFLASVRNAAVEGAESFFALGESWGTVPRTGETLLADGLFDALYDFDFSELVESFLNGRMRTEALAHHLSQRNDAAIGRYVHYLNTHDTATFFTRLDDPDAYPLAMTLLLTSSGIPLLYYGDELNRTGGEWPDNRPDMPWERVDMYQSTVLELVRTLNSLRAAHPALSRGQLEVREARDGVLVMVRRTDAETLVVAINRGPDDEEVSCGSENTRCEPLFCLRCQSREQILRLGPNGAAVWEE